MSEIELVLDGMRRTGQCVSELEDALGVQSTFEFPASRRFYQRRTLRSAPRRSWLNVFIEQWWPQTRQPQFDPLVIERLREKELFLQETRKQLRLLELSVDELTEALQARHPSLKYDSDL